MRRIEAPFAVGGNFRTDRDDRHSVVHGEWVSQQVAGELGIECTVPVVEPGPGLGDAARKDNGV